MQKLGKYRLLVTAILLVGLYLVGLLGLLTRYQAQMLALTPFTLLMTAFLLFIHHTPWSKTFILYCLFTGLASFLVEVVGVKTGLLFGTYYYGATLGWQVWGVPLVIGLNWLMLVYAVGNTLSALLMHDASKSLMGALILPLLDGLIEPVAERLDFWHWEQAAVPSLNYIGWYVVSFALLMLFYKFRGHTHNRMSKLVYIVLLCFFGLLSWCL